MSVHTFLWTNLVRLMLRPCWAHQRTRSFYLAGVASRTIAVGRRQGASARSQNRDREAYLRALCLAGRVPSRGSLRAVGHKTRLVAHPLRLPIRWTRHAPPTASGLASSFRSGFLSGSVRALDGSHTMSVRCPRNTARGSSSCPDMACELAMEESGGS